MVIASDTNVAPKSPGMLLRHYAPQTPIKINATHALPGEAILGFGHIVKHPTLNLSPEADLNEAAGNLFSMLRRLDDGRFKKINVVPIPNKGVGQAINDRLQRASHTV